MSWYSVFALLLATTATTWGGPNCDFVGVLLYEELGCSPIAVRESCPISYSCPDISESSDHCYLKGKAYEISEKVDSSLPETICNPSCTCTKTNRNETRFQCASLDCPEYLGHAPLKPNCYRKYELDQCCSSGEVCPPFDNMAKCTVDDKEYREGEKFYPNDRCLQCVCKKGFVGQLEAPFCKRLSCGEQLRGNPSNLHNSCAPVYEKDITKTCCPSSWICPSGNEEFTEGSRSEDVCKFGDKTLKVGQRFEKSNVENEYGRTFNKINCECVLPPFVTCREVE